VKSVDGYDSFITFIDDYSQYGYIYPIKDRSEALDKFKIFKAKVENQLAKIIKLVRSDHGGVWGVLRSAHSILAKSLDLLQGSYKRLALWPSIQCWASLVGME
jgi:hypothetical protein